MKSKANSLITIFVNFVKANPKAAATLAFELGLLGGEAAKRLPWRRIKDVTPDLTTMPSRISDAALKLIPGSPGLQPTSRSRKPKKSRTGRLTEKSNGQKGQKHNLRHGSV